MNKKKNGKSRKRTAKVTANVENNMKANDVMLDEALGKFTITQLAQAAMIFGGRLNVRIVPIADTNAPVRKEDALTPKPSAAPKKKVGK